MKSCNVQKLQGVDYINLHRGSSDEDALPMLTSDDQFNKTFFMEDNLFY